MPQIKIPAVYYRGGTSKGVFFKRSNLPEAAREAGSARDKILLRVLGSPDPYGKQIDGLGNASSSTSKAVILDKSERADHDVDYLFGQVSIDKPFVDWSGNCGNLTAAVGAFAIEQGLVDKSKIPSDGICTVKIWQKNIGKTIIAHPQKVVTAYLGNGSREVTFLHRAITHNDDVVEFHGIVLQHHIEGRPVANLQPLALHADTSDV